MKKGQIGAAIGGLFVFLFIVVIIVCFMGFDTVDASHIGVKNRFGVLQGTMTPGMQWTGLMVHVEQYDLRMRKMTVNMQGNQGSVDKDGQSVFAAIEINYRMNPENVMRAYSKVGRDKDLAKILNVEGIVKEGFKTVTSEYTSLEIFQKRPEVKQKAIAKIKENFPKDYFLLENVIVSNLDFNADFKKAIESKKVAEEMAKAKAKEVDIAKYEADKKIEQARGESQSSLLKARAEAEALSLKSKELTPMMVQNNWIDAWDGRLPTYMLGQNTQMLMSMGNLK